MNQYEKPPPPIPSASPTAGGDPPPAKLKLINTGPSSDGQHVHVHFITDDNRVTTVQLDAGVAASFYARLGNALAQLNVGQRGPVRLN